MTSLFRYTGWLEGSSYLLLLFIAMPLKYIWGDPSWVRVIGMAHGILFIAYCGAAVLLSRKDSWSFRKLLYAWIAAFLPFGPFVFDHRYLKREF
jgi:integral membrane protein